MTTATTTDSTGSTALVRPTFSLSVNQIDLQLLEFDGIEEMNKLPSYRFVTLNTDGSGNSVSMDSLLEAKGVFVIEYADGQIDNAQGESLTLVQIEGFVTSIESVNSTFVIQFTHEIQKLDRNNRSEIYHSRDGDIEIETILTSELEHDLNLAVPNVSLSSDIPGQTYLVQYKESNFNFIGRLCDHWGIHFYFDHFNHQIVFANDANYSIEVDSGVIFKTDMSVAQSNPLKLRDWRKRISRNEVAFNISGYDPENANTSIAATYPNDGTESLLETQSFHYEDVTSNEEAMYLAEIRHLASKSSNLIASAKTSIPFLNCGFQITTDDQDFGEAVVIKSIHKGRNLGSREFYQSDYGDTAYYECDLTLLPGSTRFFPNPSYNVPCANSVTGKILSADETSDLAPRDDLGHYTVEMFGFGCKSGFAPWLRKAQQTAGANSSDMPLLQGTEVVIEFTGQNPNCPYIAYALENSLHPSPVNHENPHHAVLATNGNLVTSSRKGRYDFSLTGNFGDAVEFSGAFPLDSSISPTVKNYFLGRGEFDQNHSFIDPSAENSESFNEFYESTGNYNFKRQYGDSVEIHQGDRLHWHNGNLYDFGGYWNYNLGNSYEENYLNQSNPINLRVNWNSKTGSAGYSGDILNQTGPDWTSVNFSTLASTVSELSADDVTPSSYFDQDINVNSDGRSDTLSIYDEATGSKFSVMNVTKDFNSSYDYKFGEAIEISDRVHGLDVTHTDSNTNKIEMEFHNNVLRHWHNRTGRNYEEKSWNDQGALVKNGSRQMNSTTRDIVIEETSHYYHTEAKQSYEKKEFTGSKIYKKDASYNPFNDGSFLSESETTLTAGCVDIVNTTHGVTNVTNKSLTRKHEYNFGFDGSFSFSLSAGGSLDIKIGAGTHNNIKIYGSLGLDVDLSPAGTIGFDSKGKFGLNAAGISAVMEARAEVKKKAAEIAYKEAEITKTINKLCDNEISIENNKAAILAGLTVLGV